MFEKLISWEMNLRGGAARAHAGRLIRRVWPDFRLSNFLLQTLGSEKEVTVNGKRMFVDLRDSAVSMRIAETRAVNRALRKAYGIGICSVEEIGSNPGPVPAGSDQRKFPPQNTNGSANGNGSAHKVRDRLCQIIRQHKLDPELVKAYAVDFCGTKALKDATREQVESFVQQLAEAAKKDRSALICQLNSYAPPSQEVAG